MNKKRIWLVLPAAAIPYVVIITLLFIFYSVQNPAIGFIMEKLFFSNALYLLLLFLIYVVMAIALTVIAFVLAIVKNWDAVSLAKTAMLIKVIQIPAYIVIFGLGVLLAITIFTYPVTILFIILDYITLVMSGLLNIAGVILAARQKKQSFKSSVWIVVLQFVYCADIVASVIFYIKLKKAQKAKFEAVRE